MLIDRIKNLFWTVIHLLFVRPLSRCQMYRGMILVVWNRSNASCKNWFNIQSSIPRNSWSLAWHHQRVYFSMVSWQVWNKLFLVEFRYIIKKFFLLSFFVHNGFIKKSILLLFGFLLYKKKTFKKLKNFQVHPVAVKHFSPRQLQTSARLTLFQSRSVSTRLFLLIKNFFKHFELFKITSLDILNFWSFKWNMFVNVEKVFRY